MVMEKKDKKRKTIFFFSRKTFDKLRWRKKKWAT
jgi:hypothetical protein